MSCSFVDVAGGSRRINALLATGSNGSPIELLVLAETTPSLVWAAGLVFECLRASWAKSSSSSSSSSI